MDCSVVLRLLSYPERGQIREQSGIHVLWSGLRIVIAPFYPRDCKASLVDRHAVIPQQDVVGW